MSMHNPQIQARLGQISRRGALLASLGLAACASAVSDAQETGAPAAPPKRILVFGDSISWGVFPAGAGLRRIAFRERWTGVAQRILGPGFEIVEDNLPGRTAGVDRPSLPSLSPAAMNGLTELPEALFRNIPLDLVVLPLGTNDMLLDPTMAAEALAQRIGALADVVNAFMLPYALEGMTRPAKTLVMAPTAIGETRASPNGLAAEVLRRRLLSALEAEETRRGFAVFNGALAVPEAPPDGLHPDKQGHERLGRLAADAILGALSS